MQGYVKSYRETMNKPIFANEKLFKVFMWCLWKASHKRHEVMVGRQKVVLEIGQFVFGRKQAAIELNMKESTVYDLMKWLKSNNTININSNNKFSIVTVENYGFYQEKDDETNINTNNTSDSKSTANQQQINTNKNVKNVKNEKNNKDIKKHYAEFVLMTEEEYQKLIDKLGESKTKDMIERLDLYIGQIGLKKANSKYKSHYSVILNWFRRDEKSNKPIEQKQMVIDKFERDMQMQQYALEHGGDMSGFVYRPKL